jgi:hypothetical protein
MGSGAAISTNASTQQQLTAGATGSGTVTFPPNPNSTVTGTISVPSAPPGAQWTVLVGSPGAYIPWTTGQGPNSFGPVQQLPGQSILVEGSNLVNGTAYNVAFTAVAQPPSLAGAVYPMASAQQGNVSISPASTETFTLTAGGGTNTQTVPVSLATKAIVIAPDPTTFGASSNFFKIVGGTTGITYCTQGPCLWQAGFSGAIADTFEPLIIPIPPGLESSLKITGYQSANTQLQYFLIQTDDVTPWIEQRNIFRMVNLQTADAFATATGTSAIVTSSGAAGSAWVPRIRAVFSACGQTAASPALVVLRDSSLGTDMLDIIGGPAGPASQSMVLAEPYFLGGPTRIGAGISLNLIVANVNVDAYGGCHYDSWTYLT